MECSSVVLCLLLCIHCGAGADSDVGMDADVVEIVRLSVPGAVAAGSPVLLDCEFRAPRPRGLVLQWLFNGTAGLVYQWIPPLRPQAVGLLKGRVALEHVAAPEPLQRHRAVLVPRAAPELSGRYTCVVSTLTAEDRQTKTMLVYSVPRNFRFFVERANGSVALVCAAEDMYPRPQLTILTEENTEVPLALEINMDSYGQYSAVARAAPLTSPAPQVFVCSITLPNANFTVTRTTTYYPGRAEDYGDVQRPQERQASGVEATRATLLPSLIPLIAMSMILSK